MKENSEGGLEATRPQCKSDPSAGEKLGCLFGSTDSLQRVFE